MYCPNCGTQNDESYNNCISCGKYIADINKELLLKNKKVCEDDSINAVKDEPRPISVRPIVVSENTGELRQGVKNDYDYAVYKQKVKKPKEYFAFSLICAILGSLAFGLAAIVFSTMTKAENLSENLSKAAVYSEKTKLFCILSVVIGVIKYVFIIGLIFYSSYSVSYYGTYVY